MRRKETLILGILLTVFLLSTSCATKRLERRLDPLSEDFYEKVQYIITNEESRIFLELPPSARADFIDDFWERRDPTPGTEENEFRDAYYQRIDEANQLFKGGGRPGWLQDRGRTYILFGPPDERQTNPMGGRPIDPYERPDRMTDSRRVATGEKASESWVYRNLFSSFQRPHVIRLVFVDSYGTGDYRLTTNLDELIPGLMGAETELPPNLLFMHELSKEEQKSSQRYLQKGLFNIEWELLKKKDKDMGSNLFVRIVLPREKLVFIKEDNRIKAILGLKIQIRRAREVAWQFNEQYTLDFREDLSDEIMKGVWEVEVPVRQWLDKGEYSVYILLENLSGNQKIEKLLPLKM